MQLYKHSSGATIALEGTTVIGITPLPEAKVWQRFNRNYGPTWRDTAGVTSAPAEVAEQLEAAYQGSYAGSGEAELVSSSPAPTEPRASRLAMAEAAGTPAWERVLAGDVQVGDRIARVRTDQPQQVLDVQRHTSAVWLVFAQGRIRPQLTSQLWRLVSA